MQICLRVGCIVGMHGEIVINNKGNLHNLAKIDLLNIKCVSFEFTCSISIPLAKTFVVIRTLDLPDRNASITESRSSADMSPPWRSEMV